MIVLKNILYFGPLVLISIQSFFSLFAKIAKL